MLKSKKQPNLTRQAMPLWRYIRFRIKLWLYTTSRYISGADVLEQRIERLESIAEYHNAEIHRLKDSGTTHEHWNKNKVEVKNFVDPEQVMEVIKQNPDT